ncbi:MAG: gliding motility protein GldN [Aureispira sp.]|nr:gliding motility protein GldN [Aureispira sp.]
MKAFNYYTILLINLLILGTSSIIYGQSTNTKAAPLDNFYQRELLQDKPVLAYDNTHEKDVLWEKRIWREIEVREKMNHHFIHEKAYFINILLDAIKDKKITAYYPIRDDFSSPIPYEEAKLLGITIDTVICSFGCFDDYVLETVHNELDPSDVKRYRLKEVWYFDEETSSMGVRILGVAPIIDRYDDNGNFLNSGPMFWAYYPELRKTLARTEAFTSNNGSGRMSWDDIFEARLFSSHIVKESNTANRRIKDYKTSPIDMLLEADKIKNEVFHFEHDLWSY